MTYVTRYIDYPNVKNPHSIHNHIKQVHSMFIDAGFTQSSDVGQYDIYASSFEYNYEQFLNLSSYGTWDNIGTLVFDFPDFYDDDGCDLKLKIGIVFSIIKNTAYSTSNVDDVSIRFYQRFFLCTSTNGESLPSEPHTIQNQGYYLYHGTNDVANKSFAYTNSANYSVVAYDKLSKSLYINICPYYRWGYNATNGYSSLFFMMGTMAIDGKGNFYKGTDCTFMYSAPYINSNTYTQAQITWNKLSNTGNTSATILNTPLSITANALTEGNAYYQNFFTQTFSGSFVSPSKNILIANSKFTQAHNVVSKIYQSGEYIGDFICVDPYTYSRTYMSTDTSYDYRFLVRVSTDDK